MTPKFAQYVLEGAVRAVGRSCLIVFLVCGLVNFPAAAANEKPLGSIIQADKALLGTTDAMIGATVYPGDALATSTGGTMRLKLGAGQLYLLGGSAATLGDQPSAVRAKVERGTVGFTSAAANPVELETPEGIVRGTTSQAYGQVTLTGPREMIVSAYRGELVVEYEGESHTIAEGKSYSVTLVDDQPEPAAAQAPQGGGVKPAVKRHLLVKLAVVAAVAVTSYFLWQEFCESSEKFEHCN
jgi:hypothetical protein